MTNLCSSKYHLNDLFHPYRLLEAKGTVLQVSTSSCEHLAKAVHLAAIQ